MEEEILTAKDFVADGEVKWCPGCGDYSILKQVQQVLPQLDIPKENIVFISGIGCSSRFPYYMNTFGMHSIHGRAPAVATGLKLANPDLSVWIITGDGDALSIGGNHLIHILRRNLDTQILLFNNEIYGLTKGQFSPTSNIGLKTKSSPLGVIDSPFNPIELTLGANASFIARTMDRNPTHLRQILLEAERHKGTSFVEIYQNCIIFNDAVFEEFTDKKQQAENVLWLEDDKPLVYGKEEDKGIRLNGLQPEVVSLQDFSVEDLWVHDKKDKNKAFLLAQMFNANDEFPRPFGVFYSEERPTYDGQYELQHKVSKNLEEDIQTILEGKQFWKI